MRVEIVQANHEEITSWLNEAKDVLLDKLEEDGVLTKDQADLIAARYFIQVFPVRSLTESIKKFLSLSSADDKALRYLVSKL